MFGNDRRKTGGMNLGGGRASIAITPTKRFTDFGGASSIRKVDPRLSVNQPRPSLFQKGSTLPPREVKSLQAANVQKIYQFMVEADGDDAPSEQTIRAPHGKTDFVMIFETIYQHLSKDYEFPQQTRLEDEVIQIFKGLGYPFPVKPSYFQPMGVGHGWPHLLDALGWLVDFVKINKAVNKDTQNIIFGDFLEQQKVQEKTLNYAWNTNTYREYTSDRKVLDNRDHPFWEQTRSQLRAYFESSNEYEDMASNVKNALEQLMFDCEEIESERGQEQHLQEEITKMRDDIRKAEDYLLQTENLKAHKEKDLVKVRENLAEKQAVLEKVLQAVGELKERIERQKIDHGLSGKEVRQMNLENMKDKETVSEVQGELDALSKLSWTFKNDDCFREQKAKFVKLSVDITKLMAGLNIQLNLEPLKAPRDEPELKTHWETLSTVWLPEINRQMHQRKLELETELSRFANKFAAAEERIQIETETLCEAKKREAREERVRRNEREEWKTARQELEKRYDALENEKEVLKRQMQIGGNLEKEIDVEREKMAKIEEALRAKEAELQTEIRLKLDEMFAQIAKIDAEKMMIFKQFTDLEAIMNANCAHY
ncbi:CBN-NDC-80 protein [Caenorhabditis brenneri]|uniref:Kinetochore protein NDC80 n=1 Tax=Caenorhabditis brenneri TaxID=135651 RepID=G0PB36_CAEBE|nr:CBN-NDC-80 protein [Caenorhabditis brenneri]